MNNIKSNFSIKDLENLSGIKAHTIRIWEKRYNLLEPERTDTNIRYYNIQSLQKLLNVSFLNNNGYKISKIAALQADKIPVLVRDLAAATHKSNHNLHSFKLAMLNFDQSIFYQTYNAISKEHSFQTIFYDVFIPLLNEIGLLWQTDTITPAHEHFITTLIRQIIIANTELIQNKNPQNSECTYVLFLPDNEIHELGLMFVNHQLIANGKHSILLGQSIPVDSLIDLTSYYDNLVFISYFTIKPEKEDLKAYIEEFKTKILDSNQAEFWILGNMIQYVDEQTLPEKVRLFNHINDVINNL